MGLFSRKRRTEDVDADVAGDDLGDEVDDAVPDEDDEGAGDGRAVEEVGPDADPDEDDEDADEGRAVEEVGPDADPGEEQDGDEDDDTDTDDEVGVPTGQVEFELADWGARERQLLDAELRAVRVRRAWEASTLVVSASDAEVVDDLIDIIEERIALDLPPDVEPVIYEVGDWPAGLEDRFIDVLIENRIAHLRGYREITVGIDDEERVDELVEEVTTAWEDEQPTEDELDGPDAQQVLSELFVGSDRLLHDPSDKAATVRFDDAAQDAVAMSLPFGFDERTWEAIVDLVETLRDRLGEAEATDEEVVEAATALRSHLRPLV